MKMGYYLSVIIMVIMFFACKLNSSGGRQSITVKSSESNYQFKAEFPEYKTDRVFKYIERQLDTTRLFQQDNDQDIQFDDHMKFRLRSTNGFLELRFSKNENAEVAWQKLQRLCMGVKEELAR